ncbi:hypothetical protein AB0H43_10840 [Hamadaea sp. NPDC050747]|uniref:hypothetical protein n=1 Tax=Hamadaea sp. NPDC050747 TaxID=3155789 RepID=UPI00340FD473
MSNQPTHDRYPQIRPTSGYADSRISATGPGPGAGVDADPELSAMLSARTGIVLTILIGQLWALAVAVDAWMTGTVATAWWLAAFQVASFVVAYAVWRAGDRRDR